MKPEMSTAVMIERVRALAPESQDGALLNQVANRIELLLAAESGMSREMACIRHALDIPPDQSVQSGVVNAFVRLNGETLGLRSRLEAYDRAAKEPVALRWRHAADEHSGASSWYYVTPDRIDDFMRRIAAKDSSVETELVYGAQPLPVVPDEVTEFTKPNSSYEWRKGYNACIAAFQSGNPVWSGIDWAKGCGPTQAVPEGWALVPAKATAAMVSAAGRAAREYMEEYGGNSPQVIYQAMLAAAPQLERKDGDA